jgi:parallel beta-helix repeat protein
MLVSGMMTPTTASDGENGPELGGRSESSGNRSPDPPIMVHTDMELASLVATKGWPGSGTQGDPYIVQGLDINGSASGYCLYMERIDSHVVIRNNTLHHAENGGAEYWWDTAISLYRANNVTIEHNTISDNRNRGVIVRGFNVLYDQLVIIRDNVFKNNLDDDIYAISTTVIVTNNTYSVGDGGGDNSVHFSGCVDSIVDENTIGPARSIRVRGGGWNNTVSNNVLNGSGLSITDCPNCTVSGNTFQNIEGAIGVQESDNCILIGNTIASTIYGISLTYCEAAKIRNNVMTGAGLTLRAQYSRRHYDSHVIDSTNSLNGLEIGYFVNGSQGAFSKEYGQLIFVNCSGLEITNGNFSPPFFGILIAASERVKVSGCEFIDLPTRALEISSWSDGCKIVDNTFDNSSLLTPGGKDYLIDGNTFLDYGIYLGGTNCIISNNTMVVEDTDGIEVHWSRHCTIVDNNVTVTNANSDDFGIDIEYCDSMTVRGNILHGQGMRLTGSIIEHWVTHDWDDSNTVDGKVIRYVKNRTGFSVSGELGQVVVANCRDFVIEDMTMSGITIPITIGRCANGTIRNCILSAGEDSFWHLLQVDFSTNITITENVLEDSADGIELYQVTDSVVSENYLIGLYYHPIYCWLSDGITLERNLVEGCGFGIHFLDSDDCIVRYNHFENCNGYVLSDGGQPNTFCHHNNFVDNNKSDETGLVMSPQVRCYYDTVSWDDGSEGNYWSEYSTRYPTATNDGNTWDTPYLINIRKGVRIQDEHPLVHLPDIIPPLAKAGPDRVVDSGTTVNFDGSKSMDDSGAIASYTWEFEYEGDLEQLTGPSPSFTFLRRGLYTIKLLVTDASGNADEDTMLLEVVDLKPPVADAGSDVTVDQGTTVVFNGTNSTDNDAIVSYRWTFEYGGTTITRTGMVNSFRFDDVGDYLVTLTVADRQGNTAHDTLVVKVVDTQPPIAHAGQDIDIEEDREVLLEGSGSTDNWEIVEYRWTVQIGDELFERYLATTTVLFKDPGYYVATLRVTDVYGNWDEDTVTITVHDITPPVADAGPDVEVDQGELLVFNSSGSSDNVGIRQWYWDFYYEGELVQLDGPAPSYTFYQVGVYVVTLVVRDEAGLWDETNVTVIVHDVTPPVAVMDVDTEFDQGDTITLDGSASTDNTRITRWEWNITHPQGNWSLSGSIVEFKFEYAGFYNVTMQVGDLRWNRNETSRVVHALDTEFPVAVPPANPLMTKAGNHTVLDGSRSHDNVGIVEYRWVVQYRKRTFELEGDDAEFVFKEPGRASVTLIVEDAAGLQDSVTFSVIVEAVEEPDEGGLSGMAVGAIAVVVVAVVLVVVMLWLRKREPPGP